MVEVNTASYYEEKNTRKQMRRKETKLKAEEPIKVIWICSNNELFRSAVSKIKIILMPANLQSGNGT